MEAVDVLVPTNQPNMKILIADDDSIMRTLLLSGLTRLDYRVEVAEDGDQAWSVLEQPNAPEIAILDWMMPGMTGVDICHKLRARKDAAYVYVILLTGMDTLDHLVKGMEAGADDYMTKPFKPAELNARLRAGRRILDLQRELLAAQAQLQILADHDSLTSLWNRRIVLARLQEELARTEREGNPVGVILLDIDHFKRINDTLGHARGDEVLQEVAKRLTESIRPYDRVGRYGGEEFLIVAANCNLAETYNLAERVRNTLCSTAVQSSSGPIEVSASFGVSATTLGEERDSKALIVTADRALYRAKELGRNRVEWLLPERSDGAVELRKT